MAAKYDFSGWATKNDLLCADGRTIKKNAFIENDGKTVPLVWQHMHDDPDNVLGHALLENRDEGVYAYCSFNNTSKGQLAKTLVQHGDVKSLSIYANQLKQRNGGDVVHGIIRELSLVLSGANPGALIDFPILAHSGEEVEDEAIIYTGEESLELFHEEEPEVDDTLIHSSKDDKDEKEEPREKVVEKTNEEKEMADEKKKSVSEEVEETEEKSSDKKRTIKDVYETLNDEQKELVNIMVGMAVQDKEKEEPEEDDDKDKEDVKHYDEEGETFMKHNVFDTEEMEQTRTLTHSNMETILANAKRVGSLREAMKDFEEENGVIMHSIPTEGMVGPSSATASQTYGFRDPDMLFPEYRNLDNTPQWISRNMDWVNVVLSGVHRTPFSRIKSQFADITEDEARAKGYIKGKLKKDEVFTLLKRTTDPQTIYKKQKMDRDDVVDITDFDVVAWIRAEMRVMLNEEIARAILIGDGRSSSSDDKINESHVRSIMNDVPLFNIKVGAKKSTKSGDEGAAETAKNVINAVIRSRKEYKGSGNPIFFMTEDALTEMLLIEDGIGHKLYKTEAELTTALRVSKIITVEPMSGCKVPVEVEQGGSTVTMQMPLIGIIVNLNDYNVGADKGGEINLFDDFDIDYNQYKYLIETRMSGALIKPFSAITVYEDGAAG